MALAYETNNNLKYAPMTIAYLERVILKNKNKLHMVEQVQEIINDLREKTYVV